MKDFLKFTEPKLSMGKKPQFIPKGSTLEKELAKNVWYIGYTYNGKRYRIKQNLNRISDYKEKFNRARVMIEALKMRFNQGYNPEQEGVYIKNTLRTELTINEVVAKYLAHLNKYARPKTIQSYHSKLRYFVEEFDQKTIKSFTHADIQDFIQDRINGNIPKRIFRDNTTIQLSENLRWTRNTVRSAKGIFRAFFSWCILNRYYEGVNPIGLIDSNTIISDNEPPLRNKAFSESDNTRIMEYLDKFDPAIAFFCRILYCTCLRPGELVKLKIKDFNLDTRFITIPLSISKNRKSKRPERIYISDELFKLLSKQKVENFSPDLFICTDSLQIFGSVPFGRDTPYKRFKKALAKLNLTHKGYVLYSFKHFANIIRLKENWTLTQIMIGNRHSSIAMTEHYLKDLKDESSLSNLTIPMI